MKAQAPDLFLSISFEVLPQIREYERTCTTATNAYVKPITASYLKKLSDRLGGMGSIESLRLVVPVEGTLQSPMIDVQGSLRSAIGGNTQSLLDALLKGAADELDPDGSDNDVESGLKSLGRKLFGS